MSTATRTFRAVAASPGNRLSRLLWTVFASLLVAASHGRAHQLMGAGVGPGSRVGFTVSAHDDDGGGERDAALYWKGISPSCWKNESGWGDVLLSAKPK